MRSVNTIKKSQQTTIETFLLCFAIPYAEIRIAISKKSVASLKEIPFNEKAVCNEKIVRRKIKTTLKIIKTTKVAILPILKTTVSPLIANPVITLLRFFALVKRKNRLEGVRMTKTKSKSSCVKLWTELAKSILSQIQLLELAIPR